jgi:hypothetical protein
VALGHVLEYFDFLYVTASVLILFLCTLLNHDIYFVMFCMNLLLLIKSYILFSEYQLWWDYYLYIPLCSFHHCSKTVPPCDTTLFASLAQGPPPQKKYYTGPLLVGLNLEISRINMYFTRNMSGSISLILREASA